jgi:outer membrane protein assembly factor BamE (lipoprotein component of BamABCDE complex)
MRGILAVLVLVALAGCVSSGTKVSEQQVSQFQKGKTTRAEVEAALGKPNGVSHSSSGVTAISYVFVTASPKAATFIPIVGMFAGGANAESATATFAFGPDNVLISSSSGSSRTSSAMGGAATPPSPTE